MRLVCGWGINDANYVTQPTVDGKRVRCLYYRAWKSMIERCYHKKVQEMCPTYQGCEIAAEWKSFMSFRAWMELQDWEGKELDKDLIGDGKLYSPETCCFVELWLNRLFTDSGAIRGEYPIGVRKNRNRFLATLTVRGQNTHLGSFLTPEEAHSAYKAAKLEYIQELVEDYPDQRIKQAVLDKAQTLYGEH